MTTFVATSPSGYPCRVRSGSTSVRLPFRSQSLRPKGPSTNSQVPSGKQNGHPHGEHSRRHIGLKRTHLRKRPCVGIPKNGGR
jgi:hypothetical protein